VEFLEKEKALRNLTNTSTTHKKLGWNVSVPFNKDAFSIGVIPDYLFGLRPKNDTDTVYFFIEVDKGTMPVTRNNLKQTSMYRKLIAYYETWKQGLHTSLFGLKRFRVLIVANGKERANNIILANKLLNSGKGSGIFLFANMSDVDSCEDILNLPFIDGHGNSAYSLLRHFH
jgi:hypothetical protein